MISKSKQRRLVKVILLIGLMFINKNVYSQDFGEQKPIILALRGEKHKVSCGGPITFLSAYALPKGTYKTEEKWSYKPLFLKEEKIVFEKPKVLFVPGEYKVGLQIKNDKGIWSEPEYTIITVEDKCKQSEIDYVVENNIKGVVMNHFGQIDYRTYKRLDSYDEECMPGKLIISNSPEKVKETGILYEGTSTGVGRLLVHHLNALEEKKDYRIVILATNLSEKKQKVHINNLAIKGPCQDVLYVGEQLLLDYWDEKGRAVFYNLPPKVTGVIYKQDTTWQKGDAISAYIDFDTTEEIKWTVACVKNGDNLSDFLRYCEKDEHIRGTFDGLKKKFTIILPEGEPTYLSLGEDKEAYLKGYDEITGEAVYDKGDFGVQYELKMKASEETAVVLNPRGDVFKGAIHWNGEGVYPIPKKGYMKGVNEASFLGIVEAGKEVDLRYMLPNGSSAPVLIVFLPKSCWKGKMSNLNEIWKSYKPY